MEKLQIVVNVGLIITAAAAVITLVLNIFKDLRLQRPKRLDVVMSIKTISETTYTIMEAAF